MKYLWALILAITVMAWCGHYGVHWLITIAMLIVFPGAMLKWGPKP